MINNSKTVGFEVQGTAALKPYCHFWPGGMQSILDLTTAYECEEAEEEDKEEAEAG